MQIIRSPRILVVLLSVWLFATVALAAESWPTRSHDARRSGRTSVQGPGSPATVAGYPAILGISINISPTVTESGGVYFGGWGILANGSGSERRLWDKSNGHIYGAQWSAGAFTELFPPRNPGLNPFCWDVPGRVDPQNCPTGGDWNYHNGTVEGTGTVGPDGSIFFGRGDGKVFKIDPTSGAVLRSYRTIDPATPDDPESGGEVVAGPLIGNDGKLYIATWGLVDRPHQTTAVYAMDPDTLDVLWRYPSVGSLGEEPIMAAPALSPDGKTMYVAQWHGGDDPAPPRVFALRLDLPDSAPDAQRVRWIFDSVTPLGGRPLPVGSLAVGSDGTLYVGAADVDAAFPQAVLYALSDNGSAATHAFDPAIVSVSTRPLFQLSIVLTFGLALREELGVTTEVYAASHHQDAITGFGASGAAMVAVDPATGQVRWRFDPQTDAGLSTSIGGLAVGDDGIVYVGAAGTPATHAALIAVNPDGSLRFRQDLSQYGRWTIPAIGPDGTLFVGGSDPTFSPCAEAPFFPYGACSDNHPVLYAVAGPPAARPASAQQLRATKLAGDLHLDWSAVGTDGSGDPLQIGDYRIVRADNPRFPAEPGTVVRGTTALTSLNVPGDLTDGTTHFYLVVARTPEGLIGLP